MSSEPIRAQAAQEIAPETHQITVYRPSRGWVSLRLGDLWRHRELVYFLAWRDVKVRYKQTALGIAWAILQPVVAMVVFSIVFGVLAPLPSEGIPYPVFCYVGLVPWLYFASAATAGSSSLVANSNLISKVYFPRLVIPLAGVVAGLVDLAIGIVLLVVLLVVFGVTPGPMVLFLPFLVLLAAGTAFAVSTWLSALDVQYRDIQYAIPFLIQVWLFATPVVYPANLVPERWRWLVGLNPMAGVVEGFRWALLGSVDFPGPLFVVSVLVATVLLVTGMFYFRRVERTFADII